jgi:hypothetical protein
LLTHDIIANGGSITLNADVDPSGGAIEITNATINSKGGNIILGGGSDPSKFPAFGTDAKIPIGVFLNGSTLNAGTGNISIRGQALAGGSNFYGISVSGSKITTAGTGSITLNGIGGKGFGKN